jgi:hypothetical protein
VGSVVQFRIKVTARVLGARLRVSSCESNRKPVRKTTFAITPAIAFRTGWQKTLRLGRQIALHLDFGIESQVPVGLLLRIGPLTEVEVDSRKPFGFAEETALGTVPGTVPTVVPGR